MAHRIAALLLLLAGAHEFVWQLWPPELQGDVRNVTQWPLIGGLCGLVALLARHRLVAAACAAVVVMSSTTAACSAAWIYRPWPVAAGEDQCSASWGVPMLLWSGLAALLVLALWRWPRHGP